MTLSASLALGLRLHLLAVVPGSGSDALGRDAHVVVQRELVTVEHRRPREPVGLHSSLASRPDSLGIQLIIDTCGLLPPSIFSWMLPDTVTCKDILVSQDKPGRRENKETVGCPHDIWCWGAESMTWTAGSPRAGCRDQPGWADASLYNLKYWGKCNCCHNQFGFSN